MDPYSTSYNQDVIDATTADMEEALNRRLNLGKAAAAAGGAFGGGRHGVAEGVAVGDFGRALGSTVGDLRARAYETAASLGQQDAGRFFEGDQSNQSTQLARMLEQAGIDSSQALTNAELEQAITMAQGDANLATNLRQGDADLTTNLRNADLLQQGNIFNAGQMTDADRFNINMLDERQRFDIGQADIGDNRRMQAIRDYENNILAGANLGLDQAGVNLAESGFDRGIANDLIDSGALTTDQLMQLLGLGTQTFGDLDVETGTGRRRGTRRGTGSNTSGGFGLSFGKA